MILLAQPVDPVADGRVPADATDVVDESAFAAWYRTEHPRLLATMTIVTRDLHGAQDINAEAIACGIEGLANGGCYTTTGPAPVENGETPVTALPVPVRP